MNSRQWEALTVSGKERFDAHIDRRPATEGTLYPKRRFLFNLKQKTAGRETSHVYEIAIDCFNDRFDLVSAMAFTEADGKGDQLGQLGERQFLRDARRVMTQAVRSICQTIVEDRSNRRVENLSPEGFPIMDFLTCSNYRDDGKHADYLQAMRRKLIPKEIEDSAWVYTTQGNILLPALQLPVTETLLGVCNKKGDIDCGNGIYIALRLDWPIEEAADRLSRLGAGFGKNYLEEVRDSESQVPSRPYLFADPENPRSTFLICDSGVL